MRLFQNSGLYAAYLLRLRQLRHDCCSFAERTRTFLADRYSAAHFLLPVLEQDPAAFFTNGDDADTQRLWAKENGMPKAESLESILLAQIEAHRTEVFYNLDPVRYGSDFLRRLPSCVKTRIAWRAAPSGSCDFSAYDLMVNNFPGLLKQFRKDGIRSAYFSPAFDPVCEAYAANIDRPIDVVFVGGYSRHHQRRAAVLEAVAALRATHRIVYCLDVSKATRWAESAVGHLLPLSAYRRPKDIRSITKVPVFGREMYDLLSQSKIVLNGAIDMADNDRGNMRCFEAWANGCVLLSDDGHYPKGFVQGENFAAYGSPHAAVEQIESLLANRQGFDAMRQGGYDTVRSIYSKSAQWSAFTALCA